MRISLLLLTLLGFVPSLHGQLILKHPERIQISPVRILNSPYRETNLSITPDGEYMFFMSMRGGKPWSNSYMEYKGQPVWDGDLYYSRKVNGNWQRPVCMPEGINTSSGEDEPNISADGRTVYFQSWSQFVELTGGPYYKATRQGASWSKREGLGGGITQFFKTFHATDGMTVSPDGRYFIVAAGRDYETPMDLYHCELGPYGWKYPVKLPVSTYGDERSVFLAGDGKTLYFASDAYRGFGGLDIYKTTVNPDGTVGEIVNLGAPFNTPRDDYGFILTVDGSEAYFVRDGDIYFADIRQADDRLKPEVAQVEIALSGVVRDSTTRRGIQANIILLDARTKLPVKKFSTNRNGRYFVTLPNKTRPYDQIVSAPGYPNGKKRLFTRQSDQNATYNANFTLAKIVEDRLAIREEPQAQPPVAETVPAPVVPQEEPIVEREHPQRELDPVPQRPQPKADPVPLPQRQPEKVELVEDPYSFDGVAENNLILLLDVSASMREYNKMPLLKTSFKKLLDHLRAVDLISVVVYSGDARVVLDGVSALQKYEISSKIDDLNSAGSTKGKQALRKAYKVAEDHFIRGGNNRIILATDGDFDVEDLYNMVDRYPKNVSLSVFCFGKIGQRKKEELEGLARRGRGNFSLITPGNVDDALLKEAKAVRKK